MFHFHHKYIILFFFPDFSFIRFPSFCVNARELNFLIQQTPQSIPNTQVVSRTSSISASDIASREQKSDEGELTTSTSKNFRLLRVPSVSNQDISINNNDVSCCSNWKTIWHKYPSFHSFSLSFSVILTRLISPNACNFLQKHLTIFFQLFLFIFLAICYK